MKLLRIIAVAVLAAGLAGCFKNEQEFERVRIELRKRPDVQAQGLANCSKRVKYVPVALKRDIAGYTRLPLDDNMPRAFCKRLLSGYLSGRLTWDDYKAISRGSRQRITPNLVAILRHG